MPVLTRVAALARHLPATRATVRAGRALTILACSMGAAPVGTFSMLDGTALELDARDRTEATAVWCGAYEPDLQRALRDLAGVFGSVVYDVGANVGLVAVPLARHLAGRGRVVCFEPVPENAARLRRNVALNGLSNCDLHEVALGERAGEVHLARESTFGASTGNAMLAAATAPPKGYDALGTARMATLDDVVRSHGLDLPDVIKLDVEGAEVGVLAGAPETLVASRPVILGEFHSGLMPRFGTTFLDAARLLPPDYAVFGFAADRTLVEKEPAVGVGDVLLVPRERVAALPLRVRRG